jgi:hypothetical protein
MNDNVDLVIARYQENLNWLDKISDLPSLKNIFIYEKDPENKIHSTHKKYRKESLPNVGREAHTYLSHIIKYYEQLNDFTVFVQGHPYGHGINLQGHIEFISNSAPNSVHSLNYSSIHALSGIATENNKHEYRHHEQYHPHGLHLGYFMDLLFDIRLDTEETVKVTYGAQFAVTKQAILSRPLDFYKYLCKIVARKKSPVEGYIFERLWLYIFDPSIPISDTYKIWI